jgi:inosine-uridine nucleoside N-ribohydrolase
MPSVAFTRSLARLLLLPLFAAVLTAEPVHVIFDTDMGNDIDDALALSVLHALESRGEARLLAVTLTKDNPWAAPFVDLVNHFYGRGNIPVGVVRNGPTPEDSPMIQVPSERKDAHGVLLYPRRLQSGKQAPEAVALIRSILEAQPDQSVVIVQVGFSTNLARLLAASGGQELVKKKVRLLSAMAGNFVSDKPEYNVKIDIASAQKVFHEWPTPIVASGYEIGEAILYPAASIENDFGWARNHPLVDAYRAYKKMPYDRPTWDLTSALYAVRPGSGYFDLSQPGSIKVDSEGRTRFDAGNSRNHRYIIVNKEQIIRVREALVQLASQPLRR